MGKTTPATDSCECWMSPAILNSTSFHSKCSWVKSGYGTPNKTVTWLSLQALLFNEQEDSESFVSQVDLAWGQHGLLCFFVSGFTCVCLRWIRDSQNGQGWKGPLETSRPTYLLKAGSAWTGCSAKSEILSCIRRKMGKGKPKKNGSKKEERKKRIKDNLISLFYRKQLLNLTI